MSRRTPPHKHNRTPYPQVLEWLCATGDVAVFVLGAAPCSTMGLSSLCLSSMLALCNGLTNGEG